MSDHEAEGVEIAMAEDGTLIYTFEEGAEPHDIINVDHLVTGFTVGLMRVAGDAAVLIELNLAGEDETAMLALDPVTARELADGILVAVGRI